MRRRPEIRPVLTQFFSNLYFKNNNRPFKRKQSLKYDSQYKKSSNPLKTLCSIKKWELYSCNKNGRNTINILLEPNRIKGKEKDILEVVRTILKPAYASDIDETLYQKKII